MSIKKLLRSKSSRIDKKDILNQFMFFLVIFAIPLGAFWGAVHVVFCVPQLITLSGAFASGMLASERSDKFYYYLIKQYEKRKRNRRI